MATASVAMASVATDEVAALLADIEAGKVGPMSGADELEDLLIKKGLLHKQHVAPRNVGFHPENRDQEGCNPLEVLRLASDIAAVGFSTGEVRSPVCVQAAPGDQTFQKFNEKLVANTGIAPVEKDTILYASISSSHLNGALRCIMASVASSCPFLAEDGFMSIEKIRRRSPLYAEAAEQGLNWKIVAWQVPRDYPTAVQVLSTARNIRLDRAETEMQGLMRLHGLSSDACRRGDEPDWSRIKASVLRSKPPYEASVEDMISFVISRGGGVDGKFLTYLNAFHRNHVEGACRRSLPCTLYSALADFPYHNLAIAIWVAAWQCPAENLVSGMCKGISAAEVNGLAKQADDRGCPRAEEILAAARTRLRSAGVQDAWDSTKLCKLFARLDVSMARFMLDKQSNSKIKNKTLDDVLAIFTKDVKAAYPDIATGLFDDLVQLAPISSTQAAPQAAAGKLMLYETSAEGKLVDPLARLRSRGFDVGGHVALARQEASVENIVYQVVAANATPLGETVVLNSLKEDKHKYLHVRTSQCIHMRAYMYVHRSTYINIHMRV